MDFIRKEELKTEYNYWKQAIEKIENSPSGKPKTTQELERYAFATGFVSAFDKSGLLAD